MMETREYPSRSCTTLGRTPAANSLFQVGCEKLAKGRVAIAGPNARAQRIALGQEAITHLLQLLAVLSSPAAIGQAHLAAPPAVRPLIDGPLSV